MRYPGAEWRGDDVPNVGGQLVAPRLAVLHVMQGTLDGCDAWFHDAAAEVSAHFGVGKDGRVLQWVDTARVAWAECTYNDRALSIEHEGYSGELLTPEQLTATMRLLAWISASYLIPLRRTADPAGAGVIGHGELGVEGCDHPDCPGVPILHQVGARLASPSKPEPAKSKEPPSKPPKEPTTVSKPTTTIKIPHETKQSSASVARQGGAGALVVASLSGNVPHVAHVNPTVQWAMMFGGGMLLFVIEHFLGDPSTGTPAPPATQG